LHGLTAAHEAGVVHRDLSPENIMLLGEPTEQAVRLKILDFGIARLVSSEIESGTGAIGKPRYMAPEQVTTPDVAGAPADLYSVSVMFYELLMGVLPQRHWQPPSGGRSDVPVGIDNIIKQGLTDRPASRQQTAKAYRADLKTALQSQSPGLLEKFGWTEEKFQKRQKEQWLTMQAMLSPSNGDPEKARRKRNGWLVVGLLVVVFFVIEMDSYAHANGPEYLACSHQLGLEDFRERFVAC